MIQYIFSINTGRSGSQYLADVLSLCEGICAFHEPEPICNGMAMVNFLSGKPALMREIFADKLKFIREHKKENCTYIESNHMFIKGFGWLVPEHLPENEIGVIILKRNPEEIVHSMERINCTPLNHIGRTWIMHPLMKHAVNKVSFWEKQKYRVYFRINKFLRHSVPGRKTPARFQNFNRKYLHWYVDETFAQAERFKKRFPQIKFFEVDINELNSLEKFEEMFKFFGLDFKPSDAALKKIGIKVNLKTSPEEPGAR